MDEFRVWTVVGLLVSLYLVPGLGFDSSMWNSCSPHPGRPCRRCDCVPDCMDLSDEKNCSYGNLDDLFLSIESILRREAARPTEPQCGTSRKFFPPPPPPPFALCDPPTTPEPTTTTTKTTTTAHHTQPPITTMPQPPPTRPRTQPTRQPTPTKPCRPSVRPSTAATRPATTRQIAVTPPPRPVPTTPNYPDVYQVWNFCQLRYMYNTDDAIRDCVQRIYFCFSMPHTCGVPLTTTTTTTTTMAPVTTYYYDYYDYIQNLYWNNLWI